MEALRQEVIQKDKKVEELSDEVFRLEDRVGDLEEQMRTEEQVVREERSKQATRVKLLEGELQTQKELVMRLE